MKHKEPRVLPMFNLVGEHIAMDLKGCHYSVHLRMSLRVVSPVHNAATIVSALPF